MKLEYYSVVLQEAIFFLQVSQKSLMASVIEKRNLPVELAHNISDSPKTPHQQTLRLHK